MDLAELIYLALRRHLGNEKEEAALRATAEKIAALWSKETQPSGSSAFVARVEQPQRHQGRGEEVRESRKDAETPRGEGDNRELQSEEDER